jgi:hypothetical protein
VSVTVSPTRHVTALVANTADEARSVPDTLLMPIGTVADVTRNVAGSSGTTGSSPSANAGTVATHDAATRIIGHLFMSALPLNR